MMSYEVGESSKSAGGSSSDKITDEYNVEKSKEKEKDKDESNDHDKHEHRHKEHKREKSRNDLEKHHHKREKSKTDLEKHKTKDTANDDHEEKREKVLKREKSKSREQLRNKDDRDDEDRDRDKDKDREVEKERKSSRGNHREGLERRDSKRKNSVRHIRRASELPLSVDTESNAFLIEFARNMDLMHHNSEPDLREFAQEAKQKKKAEGRSSKTKKVHPAIALIKSAISSRLAAIAKDREEKQRLRETSQRLRRHTISEAASLFNYEPRESTPTPNSTPVATPTHATPTHTTPTHATPTYATTPTHTPALAAAPPTTPNMEPSPAESPRDESQIEDENQIENDEREYSPDVVMGKSYTPDLMRYADVDLTPQLGVIGVVRTTGFWGKFTSNKNNNKQ